MSTKLIFSDIKFDPTTLIKEIRKGVELGARQTVLDAAEEARQALIAPSGGGAQGLSTVGFLGEGVISPNQYPHNASGALVKSIRTATEDGDAVALTDSPYASELNYGRAPGIEPSEAELEEWIAAKGLKIKAKRLAKQIARKGMAATGFWTAAENSAQMNALTNIGKSISKRLRNK
jgi:hypothetical protein